MRTRRAAQERAAEVTRQRMALLSAELAALRGSMPVPGADRAAPGGGSAPPADLPEAADASASLSHARGAAGPPGAPAPAAAPGRHARRPVPAAGRLSGWAHDRLPSTLQGRVGLAPGHLGVLALLVLASLAATTWWVLRADGGQVVPAAARAVGTPTPLVTVAPSAVPVAAVAPSAPAGGVTAPGGAGAPVEVVVDVAGKVRRPGIASLPAGSRVVDALEAAGGARRGVDLTGLNLARVLVDGEQIVVGLPPPAGVAAPAASGTVTTPAGAIGTAAPLVNLNTADQVQLEELPGVGPVTAAAILQWRSEHGAFTAVDELLEVSGIGDATLAQIAPFVTL